MTTGGQETSALDALATDLQHLRAEAGAPSYAEIALRIARLREERGVPEAQARPARTTVYDCFRTGRRRIDGDLVVDIVRALGTDQDQVAAWGDRCRRARSGAAAPEPTEPVTEPATGPATEPEPTEPASEPASEPFIVPAPTRRSLLVLVLGCVVLNLLGRALVNLLEIPLHLDMTGTAVAAVVAGPWWGALVGLLGNLGGTALSGWASVPFALCNVAGALVWGYGVRRFGMGRTVPRFFALTLLVAVTSTVLAVPIVLAMEGVTGGAADEVITSVGQVVDAFVLAVLSANLLLSVLDKAIAGTVALVSVDVLPRRLTARARRLMPTAQPAADAPAPRTAARP